MKGFKILEANYKESQQRLATTAERLSTIDTAHAALIAEMGAAQRSLHDREAVRRCHNRRSVATDQLHQEIDIIQKKLKESEAALADREKVQDYTRAMYLRSNHSVRRSRLYIQRLRG